MLHAKTRWNMKEFKQDEQRELIVSGLQVSPLMAHLLINRGYNTIEAANTFLNTEAQEFFDPFLLKDMEKCVNRIKEAVLNHEKILVYGDYDADGVSSTTIMVTALRQIGAEVDFYIPNRFTEGYGPNERAFKWAKSAGYSVIITVDTGIAAIDEAHLANDLGMDLIITDHHEIGPSEPEAFGIIHPKREGSAYPCKDLAGAGVALKVAHALLGECPASFIEIAAIGTIADLVPLNGENRLIAIHGIRQLRNTNRPGLKMLYKLSGVDSSKMNEETIGFSIAPRINAAGRLDAADPAVHLLMANDAGEALELAELIDGLNKERQNIVAKIAEEAIKEVEENYPLDENKFLVIANSGWNPGVIGIVASRLVDRFYRPAIVLSIDPETGLAKGSARSIAGFDLYKHLSTCKDILPHFGGHTMAAGMTLKVEDIEELRQRLNQLATESLTDEDFMPISNVDISCKVEDLTIETIEEIERLAPFGMGNPKPKVVLENLSIASIRKIGSNQNHIKIAFEQDGHTLDSVGFGFGYMDKELSPLARVNVLGEVSINEWNNFRKPQLFIQDLSVKEWQLFDYRGARNIKQILQAIPASKRKLITFHKDTVNHPELVEFKEEIIYLSDCEGASIQQINNEYVVLLDLPPTDELMHTFLSAHFPERIYAVFLNAQNHFFSTIPTREHFKWYYAFLAKKGSFDMKKYAADLAKHRGWSKETIEFMSQVFFELNFVTIENGLISLLSHTKKRDLRESITYQMKQKQVDIENMYLYSNYHQLKQCFDVMKEKEKVLKF